MEKGNRIIIIVLLLIPFILGIANADDCGGLIQCECGDTLTESQTMWYDLNDCEEDGLIIGADDITLDCDGYTIDGMNGDHGIELNYREGVTIQSCEVKEFSIGMFIAGGSDNEVYDNNVYDNLHGIHLAGSNYNEIYDNDVNDNYIGFYLFFASNNDINDNEINDNNYGIRFSFSSENNVFDNTMDYNFEGIHLITGTDNNIYGNEFAENSWYGVNLINSQYNTFWSNEFIDNDVNAYEDEASVSNDWNITDVGNYWSDFVNNSGYPNYYVIDGPGDGIDWYPVGGGGLSIYSPEQVFTMDSNGDEDSFKDIKKDGDPKTEKGEDIKTVVTSKKNLI